MDRIAHVIAGRSTPGTSGRTGPVYDPATGTQTAEVDLASVEEVDSAVAAAVAAQRSWRESTLSDRAHLLFAVREGVVRHEHDLAEVITAQHGKTLPDAAGEVQRALECMANSAELFGPRHAYVALTVVAPIPAHAARFLDHLCSLLPSSSSPLDEAPSSLPEGVVPS